MKTIRVALILAGLLLLPILSAAAQDTAARRGGPVPGDAVSDMIPRTGDFGIDPEYLLLATLFVMLHVNAVKGLFPSVATKPAGRLMALAFAGLFLVVDTFPGFGDFYLKFAIPVIGPTGAWKTTTALIRKAKS